MSLAQLVEGYVNLTKEKFGTIPEELKAMGEERSAFCYNCELYNGGICNPKGTTLNVKTGQQVKGCGCILAAKVLCTTCSCPAEKW